MAEVVLLVMFVAAVLYTVLAGADFGAGVVEAFVPRREDVDVALAPVWEANHVWLILIVVLTFVGFPPLYALMSTALHIPLLMVLLGIVVRGTAFTFRHYDPAPGSWVGFYTAGFRLGSLLAPLFLGVSVAALANGQLTAQPATSFYQGFIAPWNTAFCWTTGIFVCCLFAFEGAVLLAAEHAEVRRARGGGSAELPYRKMVRGTHLATILAGALVLLMAWWDDTPWIYHMLRSPVSLGCIVLATALIGAMPWAFRLRKPWVLRLAMGAQVTCILAGYAAAQVPALARLRSGDLTIASAAAPAATLSTTLWAVGIGLLLIGPATVYLIWVYKRPG